MFGFSKKKEDAVSAPNQAGQMQATKVEDDMASFEIPDFSDDDLNFDLGIGEFMPDKEMQLPPAPKGLPTEPEKDTPPVQAPEMLPEKKQEEKIVNEVIEEDSEIIDDVGEESESIPKFNIAPPVNSLIDNVDDVPKIETKIQSKKELQKNNDKKKEILAEAKDVKQVKIVKHGGKHYAQTSEEGIFVSMDVYKKIVILTEDIGKKARKGESIRAQSASLSKEKKEQLEEVAKVAKAARDLSLSADLKLFEER